MVSMPDHPRARQSDGMVPRARLVMEEHLGRYLEPQERVYHWNEDPADDRIENLRLLPNMNEVYRLRRESSAIRRAGKKRLRQTPAGKLLSDILQGERFTIEAHATDGSYARANCRRKTETFTVEVRVR